MKKKLSINIDNSGSTALQHAKRSKTNLYYTLNKVWSVLLLEAGKQAVSKQLKGGVVQ